jgi:Ca2+-transporting ATPase
VRQFIDPLILILIVASAISLAVRSFTDAAIIGGAVLINAAIGFFQERKVSVILQQLKQRLKSAATVIREGKTKVVDIRELVPGDIIQLRQGDKVPADTRLISATDLKTNEAILTGESMPVDKSARQIAEEVPVSDRTNMVFMGTLIEEGVARAVVVATGPDTEFGAIAGLIMRERQRDITPLQRRLRVLARVLGAVFLGISLLLFVVGITTGRDPLTMFLTAAAVAVAAVPESLPVSLAIVLAIGAQRILRRGGLVRKMAAAEALGSVTVIATDKTATLTEGNMTVERLVEADGREMFADQFAPAVAGTGDVILGDVLRKLALTSSAFIENPTDLPDQWRLAGSAIDKAVLRTALKAKIEPEELARRRPRIGELPFDANHKYSATLNNGPDGPTLIVLGAPEVILGFCINKDGLRERMREQTETLAASGLRILALASKPMAADSEQVLRKDIQDLAFSALVVLSDPIRQDVRDVIETAQQAGTRVVMVTGDHAQTARYVADQLNILCGPERVIVGKDLPEDPAMIADEFDVFARVTPEDKVRIVEGFRAQGYQIAMIGDGVNDAPSLLRADIGVAVGSGTDVAKEASDMVLLDDSFRTIVEAIRQGRIIFDNIKKVTLFLLSDAFTEIVLVAGSILMGLPLPLLPAQILWVNIIEDVLPAIALAWDRGERDVMKQKPRRITELFSGDIRKLIVLFAVITDIALLALFVVLMRQTGSIEYARTMVFAGLGITSLVYVFSVRSLSSPVWRTNPFANRFLNISVIIGLLLYILAIYVEPVSNVLGAVPLDTRDWTIIAGLALLNVAVFEVGKKLFLNGESKQEAN